MRQVKVEIHNLSRPHPGRAYLVALIAYLILSLRQPLAWSLPVWIGLTFLVVPLVIGLAVGPVSVMRQGPLSAFFAGAVSMFLYASINLLRVHSRLPSSTDPGQIFLVGLVASLVYAIAAGAVSCGANVLISRKTAA